MVQGEKDGGRVEGKTEVDCVEQKKESGTINHDFFFLTSIEWKAISPPDLNCTPHPCTVIEPGILIDFVNKSPVSPSSLSDEPTRTTETK